MSVELDGFQRWGVGQRLLEARLRGIEERIAILAEIACGTLLSGVLGKPVIDDVSPIVSAIVDRARAVRPGPHPFGPQPFGVQWLASHLLGADSIDVRVMLDDGRLLNGTVTGVTGHLLLATTFSHVSTKHRIAT